MNPNDLRTRIAAAIYDQPNPLSREECEDLADAVIRELGLRQERVELLTRYVTEWSQDD